MSFFRNIIFSLVVISFLLVGMEYAAEQYLLSTPNFRQTLLPLNINPLMEYAPETKASPPYHFRRNAATAKGIRWFGINKAGTPGKLFITAEEGMVRNAMGDHVINKWGYRGPYFEKEPPKNVYRIAIAGGSTTAGQYDNELTYPRILERMLNKKTNGDRYYEVINSGHYWYNACDALGMIKRELLDFKPNLVLVMSGWNDFNRVRNNAYQTRDEYCDNHGSFIDRYSLYILLNIILKKNTSSKQSSVPYLNSYEINQKSFSLYEENFHEMIKAAKDAGIDLGLISLTGVLERNQTTESIEALPQLALHKSEYKKYSQKVLIEIDNLYRRLAKQYSNVFYINTGASINSRGKELYFNDQLHGSGAGYRIHAYGIYKALNKKLKIHEFVEEPVGEDGLDPNEVEVEYLKGLFATNKIEDLSYATCMAIHRNCTHRDREEYHKVNESLLNSPDYPDREYATSVIEFVFGSILQFGEQVNNPEIFNLMRQKLDEIIKMRPKLALSYWVYGQLYNVAKKKDLAVQYFSKAYQLNPKLKATNFQNYYLSYQKNQIIDPLFHGTGLLNFIKALTPTPNHVAGYVYFNMLNAAASVEEKKKSFGMFQNLYFTTPLLIRSVAMYAAKRYVEINEKDQAKKMLAILTSLRPNLKKSIDKYQDQLLNDT